MFEPGTVLPPPWMALPEIERRSIHWRMGIGEHYLEKWAPWYRALSEAEKQEYLQLFPEPLAWRGCITREPELPDLRHGHLHVVLWRENGQPKYTRQQLANSSSPADMCMFCGHTPAKDGSITKSCFSQWWKSAFMYGGIPYCCMEQCMMAGKARLFEDAAALDKIMTSDDPKVIKALGREVKGFDKAIWDQFKHPLIVTGNYCKFSQNPALRNFLLSTGDSILVEASPYDTIWGIGLPEDDPRAQDPRQWLGQNLLGFALMEVRDELRRTWANEALCCDPWDASLE